MCRYGFAIITVLHWSDQVWTKKPSQILNISFIHHYISYVTQLKGIASSSFFFSFSSLFFFFFYAKSTSTVTRGREKHNKVYRVFLCVCVFQTWSRVWNIDRMRHSVELTFARHLCCQTWLARWLNWEGLIYWSCSTLTVYCLAVSQV